jgi:hypothetical protein
MKHRTVQRKQANRTINREIDPSKFLKKRHSTATAMDR